MSKMQLLYEKFMRIAYIFSGIFFVLFVIDLSVAIVTGSIACSTTCAIEEGKDFYSLTLIPLGVGTFVFLFAGYIFYRLSHKESDLQSVSDYKKSLEADSEESMSREELYTKLRKKKDKSQGEGVFAKIWDGIKGFFAAIGRFFEGIFDNISSKVKTSQQKSQHKKDMKDELRRIEEEKIKEEQVQRSRTKLNKTELIVIVSEKTSLTQNDSRLFVNTFLKVVRDTLIEEDEVKIAKFGKFYKIAIPETKEVDPETQEETITNEYNDVEFAAFKGLLEAIGIDSEHATSEEDTVPKEEPIVEVQPEPKEDPVEEVQPEPKEEPVIEEVQPEPKEEPVVEEVQPEPKEEPVVEEVQPEPEEEPVVEEVQPEPEEEPAVEEVQPEPEEKPVVEEVQPEPEEKPVVEDVQPEPEEEPVVEEVQPEPKEEPVIEEVQPEPEKDKVVVVPVVTPKEEEKKEEKVAPVKPAKPKVVTKTKKDYIEMMEATTDLSKNKANKFLKFFAEVVKQELAKRNEIEIASNEDGTVNLESLKEALNDEVL